MPYAVLPLPISLVPATLTIYSHPATTPAGRLPPSNGELLVASQFPLNCVALVNALLTEITPLVILIVLLSILTPPSTVVVAVGKA